MLAARELAFGYPRVTVGEGISLDVAPGEVFCLLGPNGCGKTTLFRTLLGLLPPRGGAVSLDGRPLNSLPKAARARRMGYVPQAGAPSFPFTVFETALMGRASHVGLFATPGPTDHAAARAALEAIGIAHLAARRVTEISGGERQMTLIARALTQEPALIVMDEPTASLDFGNQARVIATIRALSARGIAVVLSTHDPGHAFACADRVALMKSGRIVAQGRPETVLTPARLRDLYGVEIAVGRLEGAGRSVCAPVLDG